MVEQLEADVQNSDANRLSELAKSSTVAKRATYGTALATAIAILLNPALKKNHETFAADINTQQAISVLHDMLQYVGYDTIESVFDVNATAIIGQGLSYHPERFKGPLAQNQFQMADIYIDTNPDAADSAAIHDNDLLLLKFVTRNSSGQPKDSALFVNGELAPGIDSLAYNGPPHPPRDMTIYPVKQGNQWFAKITFNKSDNRNKWLNYIAAQGYTIYKNGDVVGLMNPANRDTILSAPSDTVYFVPIDSAQRHVFAVTAYDSMPETSALNRTHLPLHRGNLELIMPENNKDAKKSPGWKDYKEGLEQGVLQNEQKNRQKAKQYTGK